MQSQIENYVEKALQLWEAAGKTQSIQTINDAIAFVNLALKHQSPPQAWLHALAAGINYDAAIFHQGSNDRNAGRNIEHHVQTAESEADKALALDPYTFRAQMIKTYIASDQVMVFTGDLSSLVPKSGGLLGVMQGVAGVVNAGADVARIKSSQARFRAESDKLVGIFRHNAKETYEAEEFLFVTDHLMRIAEFARQHKIHDPKVVYGAILSITEILLPGDETHDELDAAVDNVFALAEARRV